MCDGEILFQLLLRFALATSCARWVQVVWANEIGQQLDGEKVSHLERSGESGGKERET